jgi:hypothetical protein
MTRACMQGSPRNQGDLALSGKPELRSGATKPSEAGRREVGVPQYERGSWGTDPRDPAEQRAAPGSGTVGRKDERDIELTNCLNEIAADSEAGGRDAQRGTHHVVAPHRPGVAP